jgi:CheY-like chemotaxis protein
MGSTVMIVEDNEILRMLAAEALSLVGKQVIACKCADEALQVLERAEHVDLVVSDIRMPGQIDGLELAKTIWQRWPNLPVILTSGHILSPLEQLPPQAVFLAKPWTLDVFYNAINERLKC